MALSYFDEAVGGVEELWVTDGTGPGTKAVATLDSAAISGLTATGSRVFFAVDDGVNGQELWTSDGTAAGTVMVADINPGSDGSFPSELTNVSGTLYFEATDGADGAELWKSNGTAAGTVMVKDINPGSSDSFPFGLTNVNGTLYFQADDGVDGVELWKSDGTAAGTVMVKNIDPGSGSSFPSGLANVNGTLYFNADDGVDGVELWKSDGTAAGTVIVKDIDPGSDGSFPNSLTNVNGTLYFSAADAPHGFELWRSDGTATGTVMVKDINSGLGDSAPSELTNVNGTLYFQATDGADGFELWRSDGTAAGTVMVKDINSGSSDSAPTDLMNVNGVLYFETDDGIHGEELWKSDGTAAGTVMVKDIDAGIESSSPSDLAAVNGAVEFYAFDGASEGLFRSDGTAAGTIELATNVEDTTPLGVTTGAAAPTIAGTVSGQPTTSEAPVRPFAHVTIGDANVAATDTLTITLGGAGGTLGDGTGFSSLTTVSAGVYRLSGTAGAITSELDALIFTPTAGAPNTTSTTTFTLRDLSSANSTPTIDSTTTVIDRDPGAAPTIAGTVSGQTTTSEAPIQPFAHVTIGDANVGATDTLTISLGGAGGTLADGVGFSGLTTVSAGVYRLSGTAGAITSELDALIFAPTAGAPNTTSTTTFTLRDLSSANSTPTTDSTTSVIDSDPTLTVISDILWQNTDGQAAIWEMNGVTQVAGGSQLVGANPGPSWKAIGTGDFNDDGHSDILWQNTSGQAAIWEMDGTHPIAGGSQLVGANPGSSWKAIGTGDFNDDGHSDILWQNTSGQAAIWEMDGTHQVAGGSQLVGANPGASWKAIGTGDFNDDGHSDILWQNTSGQAAIWEMDGTHQIAGGSQLVGANPGPSWKVVGTGDFNDDGHSDILWQNTSGQAAIWEMNGANQIAGGSQLVGANPGPSWKVVGTGDYNGDGHSDILWQNASGQAAIWEMDGTHQIAGGSQLVGANPGPNWLAIKA